MGDASSSYPHPHCLLQSGQCVLSQNGRMWRATNRSPKNQPVHSNSVPPAPSAATLLCASTLHPAEACALAARSAPGQRLAACSLRLRGWGSRISAFPWHLTRVRQRRPDGIEPSGRRIGSCWRSRTSSRRPVCTRASSPIQGNRTHHAGTRGYVALAQQVDRWAKM